MLIDYSYLALIFIVHQSLKIIIFITTYHRHGILPIDMALYKRYVFLDLDNHSYPYATHTQLFISFGRNNFIFNKHLIHLI